ncbi:MAG TPA: FecR family protein [Elusimicrobiota bacterium]|nr:FecR family protein [Elusimicrobiota bacterium]
MKKPSRPALSFFLSAALPFAVSAQSLISPGGTPRIQPDFAHPAPATAQGAAKIETLSGPVFIYRRGADWSQSLRPGSAPPSAGDRVVTGFGARADFVLADGSEIRLDPNSEFSLPEENSGRVILFLKLGKIWVKASRDYRRVFEVRTPNLVASVRGTEFSVAAGPGASVAQVYQGAVGVRALLRGLPSGAESLVLPGQSLRAVGGLLGLVRAILSPGTKAPLNRHVQKQIKARLERMLQKAKADGRTPLALAVQDALATRNPRVMLQAAEALSEEGPAGSAAGGDARLLEGFKAGRPLEDLSRPAPTFAPKAPTAMPRPPKNRQADAAMNQWFASREMSLQIQQSQQSAILAQEAATPSASPTAAMVTAAAYQQQFQQHYIDARRVMARALGMPPPPQSAQAPAQSGGVPTAPPPSPTAAMAAAMPPAAMQPPPQSSPTAQYSYTAPTIAQPSYSPINYAPPPSPTGSGTCVYTCTPGTCSNGICSAPICTCQ